jgi:protease-4
MLIGEGVKAAIESANSEEEDDVIDNAKHLQGPSDANRMTAVINVKGVILSDTNSSYENANSAKICKLIRIADNDSRVAAILLYLDTPGGEVTASDEIWNAVKRAKKPVVAYMGSMAASGGYYIASGADKIVAHRTTLTGSIGVIIETWNYHVLINRLGIEPQVYTSGKMKAMLHGGRKTSNEEKNIVQELVMSSYREFLKVVSDGRKIPYEKLVNSPLTDGRILDGKQALAAGLVDMNGYFDDAVREAEKMGKAAPGSTKVVLLKSHTDFMDMLMEFSTSVSKPNVKVDLPGSSRFQLTPGKAYYLPVNQ